MVRVLGLKTPGVGLSEAVSQCECGGSALPYKMLKANDCWYLLPLAASWGGEWVQSPWRNARPVTVAGLGGSCGQHPFSPLTPFLPQNMSQGEDPRSPSCGNCGDRNIPEEK